MKEVATIQSWALDLQRTQLPAMRRQQVVADALTVVATVQLVRRAAGLSTKARTLVDGRPVLDLTVAQPRREIVFEFEQTHEDLFAWLIEALENGSPFVSGDYRSGHIAMADGVPFDPRRRPAPAAREYVFTNVQPYARKIEIGKNRDGTPFVIQVENGLYRRTAGAAAGKFPSASIVHEFRPLNIGAVGGWSQTAGAARHAARVRGGNPKLRAEWLRRQPAIIVKGSMP